jgi:hypothetical protein|tara:strand:- start:2773 stop:3021 length:249 start_codon:yes stop_codon:yes gene_type:complete
MALMSHSSYGNGTSSKKEIMKLKKDIYMNDEGLCKESAEGMPKGWRKGKLVARAGWEMPDAEYKALKFVEAKAKQPKENKSK